MSVGPINPSQNVQNLGPGGTNVPPFVQFMVEFSNFFATTWSTSDSPYTLNQAMSHFISLLQQVPNSSPDYSAAQKMIADLQSVNPPNFNGEVEAFGTGFSQLLNNYQDLLIVNKNPTFQLSLGYGLLGYVGESSDPDLYPPPPPSNTIPFLKEAINTFLLPYLKGSNPALYNTVAPLLNEALGQLQTGDWSDASFNLSQAISVLYNSGLFPFPPIS